jgi:hypothetical protein
MKTRAFCLGMKKVIALPQGILTLFFSVIIFPKYINYLVVNKLYWVTLLMIAY